MSDHHSNQINKIFLLVFHGGMVGYLLTHNLIVPIIRNFGMNAPLLSGIEFFWPFQVILFINFTLYDFDKKEKSLIPFLIYTTLYSTLIGILFLALSVLDKSVSLIHFGPAISLTSLFIFLLGFFGYFKRFFNWKIKNPIILHIFSLLLGLAIGWSYIKLEKPTKTQEVMQHTNTKENLDPSSMGCMGSKVKFKVPLKNDIYSGEVILKDCGFSHNLNRLKKGQDFILLNDTLRSHHFRLEYYRRGSWKFKKIEVLKKGESYTFPAHFTSAHGIYRVKIPTDKKYGIQIIIVGDIPPGEFEITPQKVITL